MLLVENLRLSFSRYEGLLQRRTFPVLDGVDVDARRGEMVVVTGQSGAGKSLFAHAVLGILPRNARLDGTMCFDGEKLDRARQRALRGRHIALVPQAVTWLDPSATAGRQAAWSARAAGTYSNRDAIISEFARFDLGEMAMGLFPHQLSGGMARRVLTAIATLSRAELLIADEPTTGLDSETCRLALALLRRLANEGRAVVVITHDLSAALPHADRLVVLHAGRTIEIVSATAFRSVGPAHPYGNALRAALPEFGFTASMEERPAGAATEGCRYSGECPSATTKCGLAPEWRDHLHGRVRCHHA
jgi:peptide/nickel transport system ATP-binding protein